ncbi:hypothetical protein B0A49_08553 [Cryomyces minteri]|uniref:Something about silencing protein 4 domain-containing protein n=1 Tax=Cryomyces minteri TaxID=331657 RepID=A0A4U0WPH7_9PEZI|nr:hypothetical protein B0A49_08553 [Cryomyces minteri]
MPNSSRPSLRQPRVPTTPPSEAIHTDDGPPAAKRARLTFQRPKPQAVTSHVNSKSGRLKPPTKITVTQPHGGILQTTNGVQTTLAFCEDSLLSRPSQASTPKANGLVDGAGQSLSARNKDKRTLRSQDGGSRLKSDLAIYFPNYDEVVFDAPKQPEFLAIDTPIYITDNSYKHTNAPPSIVTPKAVGTLTTPHVANAYTHGPQPNNAAFPRASSQPYNGAQVVDFSSIDRSVHHHVQDPMTDALYFKPHRRAERKEKQLRNIEKERAMHEKVQLERLLNGLLGHDWLRVMGISGITDTEAKRYEPKRDYFVREVRALVDKFKIWKEEEKRLKLDKESALLAKEEAEDAEEAEDEDDAASNGGPPSSEIDASAARQLLHEANLATSPSKGRHRLPEPIHYRPPTPEGPFTSFYSKPYLRAAAVGKHRHGRSTAAFGHPIPDLVEKEFALPRDYLTPDAIRTNARKRRRLKRESKE